MPWSNLPTDYADATWTGDRKYTINLNDGGGNHANATITDTTTYEPTTSGGNIFYGANDANQTNDAINKIVSALGNDINNLKVNIANGGTGATTVLDALINLGVVESTTNDFQANSYANWVAAVQNYVDTQLSGQRKPIFFHAGWQGVGYGSGLAWQSFLTSDGGLKFLILFNQAENAGVKYYYKEPGASSTWHEISSRRGMILYNNSSGTTGTIELSGNLSNYGCIDVVWHDGDNDHTRNYYTNRIFYPDGKTTSLTTHILNDGGIWVKSSTITTSGNAIWHNWSRCFGVNTSTQLSRWDENAVYIMQVRGYKL